MKSNLLKKLISLAFVPLLALTACSGGGKSADDENTLKVGAYVAVSNQILKYVQDNLAKEAGIKLEIKEYSDYIQPNKALGDGDLDANFFQHTTYLNNQIKERGYQFDHGKGIYLPVLGGYSTKFKDLKELPDGAKISIINDPTNQSRSLNIFAQSGLITLPKNTEDQNVETINPSATYNPHKYVFQQIEGPQLVNTLKDVDLALIPNNFATEGGLKVKDALVAENPKNNPYANVLAWRKDTKKLQAIKKLEQLLHSEQVRQFLQKTWPDGEVIAAF